MRISDWSSDVCSSDLPAQGIVQPGGDGDQLGGRRRIQIGTTKLRRALEAAVLVEDDALGDQRGPGQEVSQMAGAVAIFGEVHHGERASDAQIGGLAEVAAGDVGELRVALRSEEHTSELQ